MRRHAGHSLASSRTYNIHFNSLYFNYSPSPNRLVIYFTDTRMCNTQEHFVVWYHFDSRYTTAPLLDRSEMVPIQRFDMA